MKGNWRIKVRLVKKSEIKSWKNAKDEGQLLNAEFIDQQGSKIQGTMFKEMVQVYEPILVVGTVYYLWVQADASKYATTKFVGYSRIDGFPIFRVTALTSGDSIAAAAQWACLKHAYPPISPPTPSPLIMEHHERG